MLHLILVDLRRHAARTVLTAPCTGSTCDREPAPRWKPRSRPKGNCGFQPAGAPPQFSARSVRVGTDGVRVVRA